MPSTNLALAVTGGPRPESGPSGAVSYWAALELLLSPPTRLLPIDGGSFCCGAADEGVLETPATTETYAGWSAGDYGGMLNLSHHLMLLLRRRRRL